MTVSKPAIRALAGLVPWALSGVSTLVRFSPRVAKVGGGDHQRGQFAVRAGGRLQRDGRQAADLAQELLQFVQQLQQALQRRLGLVGMQHRSQPGSDASRSFRLGLYFIVHEPSG